MCMYKLLQFNVITTGLYRGPAQFLPIQSSISSVARSCMPKQQLIIYTVHKKLKYLISRIKYCNCNYCESKILSTIAAHLS